MLFNYCRNLEFEQKPDYGYFKKGLKSILDNSLAPNIKPQLDWLNKNTIVSLFKT